MCSEGIYHINDIQYEFSPSLPGTIHAAVTALVFATHDTEKDSVFYYILAGASATSVLCALFAAFSTAICVHTAKIVKRDKWYRVAEKRRQSSSVGLKESEVSKPFTA